MDAKPVSPEERAFYVEEFRGETLVVALPDPCADTVESVRRAAGALASGGARLVVVLGGRVGGSGSRRLVEALPSDARVLTGPIEAADPAGMADLWLAITDHSEVVVEVLPGSESLSAARLAVDLGARKLVLTDPAGGWGDPPRSFVDVHDRSFEEALAGRQGGDIVGAVRHALTNGVASVNLCQSQLVDEELFTFDGVGSLFTPGDYLRLDPLRVDDLTAVNDLVAQGTADGLLRPRTREEIARLAVTGLGARVRVSGHLAGLVSLETEPYLTDNVGEVACLYTVSRFSGAGAGGMLIDGLVERATRDGLDAVFAVTVSPEAARFFVHKGFVEVGPDDVPDSKWTGYDSDRRLEVNVLLHKL